MLCLFCQRKLRLLFKGSLSGNSQRQELVDYITAENMEKFREEILQLSDDSNSEEKGED